MRFIIQLILPVYDNNGKAFPQAMIKRVRAELTDKFGGVTAYTRAPAEGTWEDAAGRTRRDDVITIDVMADTLDREWWQSYAAELAERFTQEALVVTATQIEDLSARRKR